jgi:FdrA protein
VLGEGAHPDPASELAPAIKEIRKKHQIDVTVLLIGTEDDPQGLERQREMLEGAGATVFMNTMDLVSHAVAYLGAKASEEAPAVSLESLTAPVAVLNIGLETFYESLTQQGAEVVQVDWRPPAGGDERLMDLLAKMKTSGKSD